MKKFLVIVMTLTAMSSVLSSCSDIAESLIPVTICNSTDYDWYEASVQFIDSVGDYPLTTDIGDVKKSGHINVFKKDEFFIVNFKDVNGNKRHTDRYKSETTGWVYVKTVIK